MKRYVLTSAVAVMATFVMASICASAGFVDEYSATLVHNDGNVEETSKIYVSGDKVRIEPEASYEPVIIARKSDGVMYTIDRDTKSYMKEDYRASDLPAILAPITPKWRKNLGEETVDGKNCMKAEIKIEDKYGHEQKEIRYYEVYTQRLLKVEAEDGDWSYTLKDIASGRLDGSLFEPPDDYESY